MSEEATDLNTEYLDQNDKIKADDEEIKNESYDTQAEQNMNSRTNHLDGMTENDSVQLLNSESKIKPMNKDDEIGNINHTEQRFEKSGNEMKSEQTNGIICDSNPFMLERRISQINKNGELMDKRNSEPVEIFNTQITETRTNSSEKRQMETKPIEEETNIKENEGRLELNAETTECKTEHVINRSLSDIMMKTIEFGKDTKCKITDREDTINEIWRPSEKEHMNEKSTNIAKTEHGISVTENINETNTSTTAQLEPYSQHLEVNNSDGNINKMSMKTYGSEPMETGVNDNINMKEINKVVTKHGYKNETVVKNTVLMATSSNILKENDVHVDEVVETSSLHSDLSVTNDVTAMGECVQKSEDSDTNNSKIVEESVLISGENDKNDSTLVEESGQRPVLSCNNDSTAAEESVQRSKVIGTKDSKSTTRKIKDVRFSLPDVLVDMVEVRPAQRSLSLEDLAGSNSTAVDVPPNTKPNDKEDGAQIEVNNKKVEEDINGQRNGFNELLRGFYKTRDLIRREMSYTKQWESDNQSTEEEISENPDIILEVSEPETEKIKSNSSNISKETNIVAVTSVMLHDEDSSGNQNMSLTRKERLSTTFVENQRFTVENEVVSAPTDNALPIAFDVNETASTTFSGNASVVTAKENTVSSAFSQNRNLPSSNVINDENINLVTQKTVIAHGEECYNNCISVTADETYSNFQDENGRDDIQDLIERDPNFCTRSLHDKGTQTDGEIKGLIKRPIIDQKLFTTRSNLILSKSNTDITNIKGRTLPNIPSQITGRKTKSDRNVQDWFNRNDTTQLSTLTLRGHYPDISYIDEPYYISRSWQRENNTRIPYYPFFEGNNFRNTYGIDTRFLTRKIYLPTSSERYKKVNSRSPWSNSKSTWVKRLYTNPNHHRYVSRQYHGNINYKKLETYYSGTVESGYQQRPGRCLVASPGFIAIPPDVEESNGCFHRNKCIWPLLAVISALVILILVSVIVIILIL